MAGAMPKSGGKIFRIIHVTNGVNLKIISFHDPQINKEALQTASIDFDSSSSKLKLKVNKKKKRYNVYTIKHTGHHINFVLPSKKTSSFCLSKCYIYL